MDLLSVGELERGTPYIFRTAASELKSLTNLHSRDDSSSFDECAPIVAAIGPSGAVFTSTLRPSGAVFTSAIRPSGAVYTSVVAPSSLAYS